VLGTVIVAATLIGLNYLVAVGTARSKRFCAWIEGEAVILVRDGKLLSRELRRNHVPPGDLEEAARSAHLESVDDIAIATLETSGEITVVPKVARKR
jgi:uncharacterized membrane protein YcaP (DUF421 family)